MEIAQNLAGETGEKARTQSNKGSTKNEKKIPLQAYNMRRP